MSPAMRTEQRPDLTEQSYLIPPKLFRSALKQSGDGTERQELHARLS